MLIEKTVADTR